jgi:hypothetical protein
MFNIPFLFKTPFDGQTIQNVILGTNDEEDGSSSFSDNHSKTEESSSSGSSNSSSEESDSRFMDEKGTSFIALHPHQRVSVVNPSLLPKHILDNGTNDDISQISLDFGDVSSIESSVRLNPYGASLEQMEIAMRWRRSIAAAQQNDLENCDTFNEVTKKPMIQKEKRNDIATLSLANTVQGNMRPVMLNGDDRGINHLEDTSRRKDSFLRQIKDTLDSPPPPPPPRKHKKKFSESQLQISPASLRPKSLGDSCKRMHHRPTDKTPITGEFDRTTKMVYTAPRNASCTESIPNINHVIKRKNKIISQHEGMKEKHKKDIDTTLPISDSDDDSLDHLFRVEKLKKRNDSFRSLFEPFDDNVSIENFSLAYSESAHGSLQSVGMKDACEVTCTEERRAMDHASVIIQSLFRGWLCRYRILSELGIAKRRHWQKREKTPSVTKIHSSIRRDARKLLRSQYANSMVVAVRIVCAKTIQRNWRKASLELKNRRETGFDLSHLPRDWYENIHSADVGIPFFKDDFEAIVGISVLKEAQSSQSLPNSKAVELDTEYYKQANQNIYDDDAADDALEVHENSQFIASISLLPKIFNGIVGRFVKIFRKNKHQHIQEGKKVRTKDKKVLRLFKRSKQKNKPNPMDDDLNFETSLPDPLSLYEPLEDDTPDVAWTASFESVPFDEI